MRDIIWTIILIWLVYKIVSIFKTNSITKSKTKLQHHPENPHASASSETKADSIIKNHLNNDGEYVDYEEIK